MFKTNKYNKVKQYLVTKDGNTHTLMINNKLKTAFQELYVDNNFNVDLNEILVGMQNDGYEIINVTNSSYITENHNIYYQTLIMYK